MIALKTLLIALLLGTSTLATAQFNRVGNSPSLNASWVNLDPDNTSDWNGFQLTNTIPLGVSAEVFNQPVRFNADLNAGYVTNGDLDANFGSFGLGVTTWLNNDFDRVTTGLAPYLRLGLAMNSGNVDGQNNYVSYQVEPGLVAKIDNFYGLVAFNYGEGFNSDHGSVTKAIGMGVGVNLNKSFAIEGRYDLGYGSYDVNKLAVGLTYKF